MSGHSKWSQIKHKKAITDAKKGKVFSKIARMISVAAREGGGDPSANYKLRMIIDKAKTVNMPGDNVDRAIKKGTGGLEGVKMEEFTYEAYGPGGIALIIEGITDNKNRTLSEIKHLLSSQSGKFAETGSVSFLFQKKGIVIVNKEESEFNKAAYATMTASCSFSDKRPKLSEVDSITRAAPPSLKITKSSTISATGRCICDEAVIGASGIDK